MENASHALIMAGSVLIALLVISVCVHLVRTASTVGENYELRAADIENQKFNEKFYKYAKNPKYTKNDLDGYGNIQKESDGHIKTKTTITPGDTSYKFADFNTIADVVSAVNQAYNLNKALDYDTVDGVDIIIDFTKVDLPSDNPQRNKKYGIVPDKELKQGYVYELASFSINENNHKIGSNIKKSNKENMNNFLAIYSVSKLDNDNKERLYKYGFKGTVYQNSSTNQVDCIEFTLVQNLAYGNDI